MSGQQHARPHFIPGKDPVPIVQGAGWGPRAGLDGRKIASPPGFDPGPPARSSVAIPTELTGPQCNAGRVKDVSDKVGLNRPVLLKDDNTGRSEQVWSRHNDVAQAARQLRKLENVKS